MFPTNFDYAAPRSLDEVLDLLKKHGAEAKLLAGGHSLIPAMKLRLTRPGCLIDLSRVPGLSGVHIERETLIVGALTTHADVASSSIVRENAPALADAAVVIGDVQVRNRGTIGGSAAHADPAADLPVALTALDASFVLVSVSNRRTVGAKNFFKDFYTTAIASDEVLVEIRVPAAMKGSGSAYAKLPHPASGYVVVSAGAWIKCDRAGRCESARVAIGGLGGVPLRAAVTEAAIEGKTLDPTVIRVAAEKAAQEAVVDDDLYATAEYKRHAAGIFARRALEQALERSRISR
jgi:carbon-monoxide dehydrogenase medium subunit